MYMKSQNLVFVLMIIVFFLCGLNLWLVYIEFLLGLIYIWIYKSEITEYGKGQKIMLTIFWTFVLAVFTFGIYDGTFSGYKF